jgi:nicotinate dehydrogenase subunit B
MKNQEPSDVLYPEQYELYENNQNLIKPHTRRRFFKLLGGGVATAFTFSEVLSKEVLSSLGMQDLLEAEESIAAWIHVHEDGKITVYTGKVEVGQNIRTSLAQAVAEELECDVHTIEMIMGDTFLTPYDRGTFGSRTTPYMAPQLRKAAASLRNYFEQSAAKQWKTELKNVKAQKGSVLNLRTGKSFTYGRLSDGKKLLQPVNEQVSLKSASEWRVAGSSLPKINGEDFVTGRHKYTSDMTLPDMLHAKILRPPAYGARLVKLDARRAEAMEGVQVHRIGDFVGVTAADISTAESALFALRADWEFTQQTSRSEIFQHLKMHASVSGEEDASKKEAETMFQPSANKLDQSFEIHYIAHAPLEPRAALAQWDGDILNIWTGTQRPFGVQEELEREFNISKEKIRVRMPDTGSGYGGKHTGEAAIEAARLAKSAGKPVKLVWTREEEFTWAYFRPAGLIEVRSSTDASGFLQSWEFHNYNSGGAGIRSIYTSKADHTRFHSSNSPLRQGSYRALATPANTFARESQINDHAIQVQEDPLDFRMKNLEDERLKHVLKVAAEAFGWKTGKKPGTGFGLACGFDKGGYMANCAEVQYDHETKDIRVLRLVGAFDCGAIVNPKHLESQIMGCILQGLGGALYEYIDFRDGKILNPSFSHYKIPRFQDIPDIQILLVDRKEEPSAGAGETPITCVAPAIRNAIFDATKEKINRLPMLVKGL